VFDGQATQPYRESEPVAPAGAYARSKVAGEVALREVFGDLQTTTLPVYLLRTSWLFGPRGASFVRTMLRLMRERDEVRVVDDQRGRPTYVSDLCEELLRVSGIGGPAVAPGIYHFANTGACSWFEFAQAIWNTSKDRLGLRCSRVTPITTADYPTPAKRPAYSVLSTDKYTQATGQTPRPWQAGLHDFLQWYAENPS
jgi:dTDP-4-dehydrorhamnose reductase